MTWITLYFLSDAWNLFFFLGQSVDESAFSLRMGATRHRMRQMNALCNPGRAASDTAACRALGAASSWRLPASRAARCRCRTATSSPCSGPSGAGYRTTRCQGVRSEDQSQNGELSLKVESFIILDESWRYPIKPKIKKAYKNHKPIKTHA